MTSRAEVYAAIDSERDYQQAMAAKAHGDPSNDYTKSLENFALYIDDYVRELKTQLSRTWGPDAYAGALATTRKIAALSVAAMEVHGAPSRTTPTKHQTGVDLT
jgi:hypothetical protein